MAPARLGVKNIAPFASWPVRLSKVRLAYKFCLVRLLFFSFCVAFKTHTHTTHKHTQTHTKDEKDELVGEPFISMNWSGNPVSL